MRLLGVTETCDLGSLYMRLSAEGHDVRVLISEPAAQGTLAGLIDRAGDLDSGLEWIRAAGRDGIVLFESVSKGFGEHQDALRRQGFQVIGGSAFGNQLENDRAFGQRLLAEMGFPTGHVREFSDAGELMPFWRGNRGAMS